MADNEAGIFIAPLCDAERRSAKREQGAYV